MRDSGNDRRSFVGRVGALLASLGLGTSASGSARARPRREKKTLTRRAGASDDDPLYASAVVHDGLVYVSGIGAHFEGDVKAHTDHVLEEMAKRLDEAGSSMEQALKVSVFLHDLKDYEAMNEVYRGRFGERPPVRTTVATSAGVPGDSLVEMDCIAVVG